MRRALVAGVISLLISACGDGSRQDSEAGDPGTPEASDSGAPGDAGKVLRDALSEWTSAGSGTYEVMVTLGPYEIVDEGEYSVDHRRSQFTRVQSEDGEDQVRIEIRMVGRETWTLLQVEGGVSFPCWMSIDDEAWEQGTGVDFGSAQTDEGVPAAVVAASYAEGGRWDGDSVVGTTDLALAVSTVSGKMLGALEIPLTSKATVRAEFEIEDGELRGWSTTGEDILAAMREDGMPVNDVAEGLPDADITVAVRYPSVGDEVSVERPPGDEVVPFTPQETFEDRMDACERHVS